MFRAEERKPGPELPSGEVRLEAPPAIPPPAPLRLVRFVMVLPMLLMPAGMILMFVSGGRSAMPIGGGLMSLGMVSMMATQMMQRTGGDSKQELNDERDEYLRYLASQRKKLREAVDKQHEATRWNNPPPEFLIHLARSKRLWERQPADEDFGEVRVGVGTQPNGLEVSPPETVEITDLEPVSSRALRRLVEAYADVTDLPIAVSLLGFARLQIDGDPESRRSLARSLLAQVVTAHGPSHVRIAVCASSDREENWDWIKWLPHNQHPKALDGAGQQRLFASSVTEMEQEVIKDLLANRRRFEAHTSPTSEEPQLLVLVDGLAIATNSRLAAAGYRGVLTVDVDGALPWRPDKLSLRLKANPGDLVMGANDLAGDDQVTVLGSPDEFSIVQCRALAKTLAQWRVGVGSDTSAPISREVGFCEILGIEDAREFDPQAYWRVNGASGRLCVPIGLDERGGPVELDIRESAQGGMGPHGMLVGATGSGKSELLRTLVLAMAVRHSSEFLNFVLVDFKGGATFVGLDRLPHTSALITNLADELPLVDRMQDAIHGELVRRQELLRSANYASLFDYERARASGVKLDPLPSLFLVIDEFSELLAARRDFINLFMMVGRLGRSLGVHLLLATQRVDEGRVHSLEGHLSYRIGLRTFSASESRSVLGVTDAFDSPLTPGMGFLKTLTAPLQKFKAGYVSGELQESATSEPAGRAGSKYEIVSFTPHDVPMPEGLALDQATSDEDDEEDEAATEPDRPVDQECTTLHTLVQHLIGSGPDAHRVWLPPLDTAQPLDTLIGEVAADPERGLMATGWRQGPLRVPVGYIDRPFEQRWDTLIADLAGQNGNVGIVGTAQAGKSTLLRTMILSLALLNTPSEVRFYCLDFSNGALTPLAGLPHMSSIGQRRDHDLVNRIVQETSALIDSRERLFAQHGIASVAEARQRRARGETPDGSDLADVFLVVHREAGVRVPDR
jgi:DNA segregation ATPase FtsK/SpoIIIE, S-DNA-T family